jgi:DNA-binding SARP family transcriptional activator/Tfp pilus assembly protein PilF
MHFGVLGPLQVVGEDLEEPQAVSAPRLRVLLAVLLWNANQPVPLDELAEIVWDGAPPRGAPEAVRALVMRLRRQLGTQGAARIVTRAPGYAIKVSDDELDASTFETLARKAGAAVRSGRWAEAARTAAEALDLWRGTPLIDIPSQILRDQWVPGLEQLHVQALEWRIEADLHEGRFEQLVPELRGLAARHPLREHFHAQLVLALVRSGRQAEALAAYQEARRLLADELGIAPGVELRQLHERILTGDPSLVRATAGTTEQRAPAATPIPRQLPAGTWSFVGRQAELGLLRSLIEQAAEHAGAGGAVVIAAIDGMAGVGKTALAVQVAHRLAGEFPDGQLFTDMHGYTQGHEPRSAGETLDWFLRTLGVPPQLVPADTEERAALFRQRLAGTKTMIVLDNADSEAQVRPLLPGGAGCLVLITSRRRLKGLDDARILTLDVLPQADARALFSAVAGPGRVPADDPVLSEIVGLCARLPLALRIAAALLRHRPAWTLAHLAGLLRAHQEGIAPLSDGERDLGAILGMSYDSLTGAQQQMCRRLGLVPGPDFDSYATAALTGDDPAISARLLEDLVDHNLLLQHTFGRYRLHDLIRLHVRTLAARDPLPARDAALGRLLDYYQHTAGRADALISRYPRLGPPAPVPAHSPELPDADAGRAWLRAERPNLLAALQHVTSHAQPERAVALTANLATLLDNDGPWSAALALHADAVATARSLGDRSSQADALFQQGAIRSLTGDYPGAVSDLEQALHLYRDLGNTLGQANALTQRGSTRDLVGHYSGAVSDLEQALHLYQELGNTLGQANALTRLGNLQRRTGDLLGAIRGFEQALPLYRQLGDPSGQANVLTRRGDARRYTGDFPGALRDLEQALELWLHLDHRLGRAHALTQIGAIRSLTGDNLGAVRDLEQALRLYQDLGNRLGQANALVWLGGVRLSAGDLPGAGRFLQEALDAFRSMGSRGSEAWALNRYAAVTGAAGDHAHAKDLFRDALRLARETGQLDDEALALEGIGECQLRSGEFHVGTAHLSQALEIFQRLAMRPDADRVHSRLASLSRP